MRVAKAVESLQCGYQLLQHRQNERHLLRLRGDGRLPVLQGRTAVRHQDLTKVLSNLVTQEARQSIVLGTFLQDFCELGALIKVFDILKVGEYLQLPENSLECAPLILLEHDTNTHDRVTPEEDNRLSRVITNLFNLQLLLKELNLMLLCLHLWLGMLYYSRSKLFLLNQL